MRQHLRTVAVAAAEPDVAEPAVAAEAPAAAAGEQAGERRRGGGRGGGRGGKRVLGPARTMATEEVKEGEWYNGTVVSCRGSSR